MLRLIRTLYSLGRIVRRGISQILELKVHFQGNWIRHKQILLRKARYFSILNDYIIYKKYNVKDSKDLLDTHQNLFSYK